MQISSQSVIRPLATPRQGTVRTTHDSKSGSVDVFDLNTAPAENMSVKERRLGWAQKGASAAVATFNTLASVGTSIGLGAAAGAVFGLPGAIIGSVAGLAGGLSVTAFGERSGLEKPLLPIKKFAAKVGAKTAAALSKPLQKIFPKAVKEYELTDAVKADKLSKEEIANFTNGLQKGDLILTMGNDDPLFHTIVSMKKSASQHGHVALYAGDGETVEAVASRDKVVRRNVSETVDGKSQLMAIRPRYQEGKADAVVDQADTYLGRDYDWLASLSDKRLGCVEVPYHSFNAVAPEHQVPVTKVYGLRDFIFPSDYVHTTESDVVASVGIRRDSSTMRKARYADVAQQAIADKQ